MKLSLPANLVTIILTILLFSQFELAHAQDYDGDLIADSVDLDDDNDGIPDDEECSSAPTLVTNGDFSTWLFSSGWDGNLNDGSGWNMDPNPGRAWFPGWGNGTYTLFQTINVSANTLNTITFDVGADIGFPGGVATLNVFIDGVNVYSETSTSMASAFGEAEWKRNPEYGNTIF